jgi:5-methylcytosine-specific restriction protein A
MQTRGSDPEDNPARCKPRRGFSFMPTAAPKPCCQCGVLVTDGTTRCAAHKRKAWAKPVEQQGRGGRPWRRKREAVLARDAGLCQPSRRHGLLVPATTVDHIVPLARGGSDDDTNLQAISASVHAAKTAAEAAGVEWDEDAWFARQGGGVQISGTPRPDTDLPEAFLFAGVSGEGVPQAEGWGAL